MIDVVSYIPYHAIIKVTDLKVSCGRFTTILVAVLIHGFWFGEGYIYLRG